MKIFRKEFLEKGFGKKILNENSIQYVFRKFSLENIEKNVSKKFFGENYFEKHYIDKNFWDKIFKDFLIKIFF